MTLIPYMARPSASQWTCGVLALAAYATCLVLARRIPAAPHPGALAAGVTFDLTVSVPVFYYFLCVRGRQSLRRVVPVVLLGLLDAEYSLSVTVGNLEDGEDASAFESTGLRWPDGG